MLKFRHINHLFSKRLLSTSANVLEHLRDRTLLRVSGAEVSNFLQGLITNDIEHVNSGLCSMYTMFLNSRGRILYDTIIYRTTEKDAYLIECDTEASESLQKHLRLYRVRRKIDIASLNNEFKIYALYNSDSIADVCSDRNVDREPSHKLNESSLQIANKIHHDVLIYRDPRITSLGSRIIAKIEENVNEQISKICNINPDPDHKRNYRWLRYMLGVGEGIHDLTPGESFPLECNCDYLHGVSFYKGCYVGQELTARVYHTGVVRKRLMPIHFTKEPSKMPDEKVIHENVNLGKLRGVESNAGLGLFRIEKALAFKEIKFGDGIGTTCKPNWWPHEAPKEKISVSKVQ